MSDPMMVMVDALTAENARLRAEAKDAKRLRADDLANLATVHAALFRALGLAGCGANTPPLDCIRMLVDRNKADLARVTAERDALLAAASRVVRHWLANGCNWDAYQDALREAIAACAPPASGEVKP